MKNYDKLAWWVLIGLFILVTILGFRSRIARSDVSMEARVPWNCVNFKLNPQPMPVSHTNTDDGKWTVGLADGSTLYGETFLYGDRRLMKWTLDEVNWWTNGKDIVFCQSDVKSISILLSKPQ